MPYSSPVRTLKTFWPGFLEWLLLLFVAFSVIVRGGKGLEATWLLAIGAVLLVLTRWWIDRRSKEEKRFTPLGVWSLLLLFLAWSVLSFAFSSTQNYGLDELLRDFACAFIFFWVVWRVRGEEHHPFTKKFVTILAVTTVLASFIGIGVYILQPVSRFVGTFFDWRFTTDYWPNAWAEYLLLTWPVVFLWIKKRGWILSSLGLGLLLGALLLSFSRGGLIALVLQLGLAALGVLFQMYRKKTSIKQLRSLGVILVGAVVIGALLFVGTNLVRERFHEVESVAAKATFTAAEGASSISERAAFWKQSFALSLERPLIGWGPYSFRFVQPRLQESVFATADHPHNVFLKIAMERGWPALGLYLAFLALILIGTLWRVVRHAATPLQCAVLIAILGVLAHNMIDYNLQFVGIALPFWMLLALLVMPSTLKSASRKRVRIVEILLALLLAFVVIFEGRFLMLSSLGRHEEAQENAAAALMWYDKARLQIFSRDMHLSRASLLLSLGKPAEAGHALDDYAAQNSEDARLWVLRGYVANNDNAPEEALHDFAVAMQLGKYNYLEPFEGTLQILTKRGSRAELTKRRAEFEDIFAKFTEALNHNTHFIDLSENVEVFDRIAKLLIVAYPVDRTRYVETARAVREHALSERQAAAARDPGLLW